MLATHLLVLFNWGIELLVFIEFYLIIAVISQLPSLT